MKEKLKLNLKYSHNLKALIMNNKSLTVLACILLLGIFLGSLSVGAMKTTVINKIGVLFLDNFKNRSSEPLFFIFISSLSSVFIFVLLAFFMGLSVWGFIMVPFVPLVRGIFIGFTQSYLYSQYGLYGIAFQLVVLFPGIFVSSIAILLITKEAMALSHSLSNVFIFNETSYKKRSEFKTYLFRGSCVFALTTLSAIIDTVLNFAFLRFFSF